MFKDIAILLESQTDMGMIKQAMYFSWGLLLRKIIEQYYKYEGKRHIKWVFGFA